jgi:hypothetical protein
MSNPVTQLKPPSSVAPLADLSDRAPAPTGQALDSLVDQILARASSAPTEDAAHSGGLTDLTARLPPGAAAAREAARAAQAPAPAVEAIPAASLIDENAAWLPSDPERRDVFLQVFRFWHAQVQPQYAAQATPAFLYLVTALPVLIKARDALKADNLWEPRSEQSLSRRDAHPAWKKYCEFLPRAQQATIEIKTYSNVSLTSGLDDLFARVTSAERMFRQA